MPWGKEEAGRICGLMQHQEQVLNQRVMTLVTLNGLGFLALAWAWEGAQELVPILSLVGAAGSAVLAPPIVAADAGIARLLKLWEANRDPSDNTPIVGLPESFIWRIVWLAIPVLFVVIWAKVLLMVADDTIFNDPRQIAPMIKRFE